MKKRRVIAVSILVALAMAPTFAERDPALAGYFAAPIRIETRDGNVHKFTAYLALTSAQKTHGLMHVKKLPDDHGMLFLYDRPRTISMWMKNTLIPLDMLFIHADGTIANIVRDTVPQSLALISSEGKATAVLELNAGTSDKLGLASGDQVIYRAFNKRVSAAKSPATAQH